MKVEEMTNLSNWSVVIVDDEPQNIGVLELVFRYHNIEVHSVESGLACLELIDTITPPTLLIIDIQMPGMSGYELLDKLREHPIWGQLPMIAVTAHALEKDREKILNAGFDGYIPKPVNVMSFVDDITKILNLQET